VLSLGQPVEAAAWKDVPSTYLVCRQDRGTSEERQREYAQRAGRVVDLDAGHHPFLSQPAVGFASPGPSCPRDRLGTSTVRV